MKKASQSISLIAGNYADDSETDEDHESPSPKSKKKNRQGVHVKVQKPASKQVKRVKELCIVHRMYNLLAN